MARIVTGVYEVEPDYLSPEIPRVAVVFRKCGHDGNLDTVKGRESRERAGQFFETCIGPAEEHACSCPAGATEAVRQT